MAQPTSVKAQFVDIYGYPVGKSYRYVRSHTKIPSMINCKNVGKNMKLRRSACRSLASLRHKASQQGIHLYVRSAYRNFTAQNRLYRKYGKSIAEKPGYSEHNLGTAVDFSNVKFNSKAFLWLLKKGIKAGWVPTYYYRKSSKFVKEPWHWRYVGKKPAQTFYNYWKKRIRNDINHLKKGKSTKNKNPSKGYGIVVTKCKRCLNIRQSATKKSPSLGVIAKGAKLRLLSINKNWYKVKFGKTVGYVHKAYIKK